MPHPITENTVFYGDNFDILAVNHRRRSEVYVERLYKRAGKPRPPEQREQEE